jgi:S1-C subfamily serine protease
MTRNSRRRLFHARIASLVVAGLVAIGVVAGLAYARTRSAPVGTGVVVIDTQLAYQSGAASGTGMVLTSSGRILTNNHVIRGATSIRIVVPGTGRSYTAKVVGYDVTDDVAVLQATGASNLKTVSTAASGVRVGQSVKAIGNAGGSGSLVTASGTITGIGRAITVSDDSGGSQRLTGLLETNAGLQPGDSGGPLENAAGKVVGMDTAASVGFGFQQVASDDGYAIPISKALVIAKQIAGGKSSTRVHIGSTPFLGVSVTSSSDGEGSGAVIAGVVSGGPAATAGLVPGDVITSIGGRTVTTPMSLASVLLTQSSTAKVAVTYLDQTGAQATVTVTLASGPPQ